jgi:pimeloyl-[acyl-carrier protein] synthase
MAEDRTASAFPTAMAAPSIDMTQLLFNPFLPDVHADPYPHYHRLRETEPVHQPFPGAWMLSRHRDIVPLLRSPHVSSDRRKSPTYELFLQSLPDPQRIRDIPPSMLFLDPPDHTRLRGLVNKAFTARVVESMRPRVLAVVRGILDEVAERGELDVIADLAYPIPVTVICDLLAVPESDRPQVKEWSLDLIYTLDPLVAGDRLTKAAEAGMAFREYLRELISVRRAQPGEDVLSALIHAEDEGERLTEEEVVSMCVLLLIAGHETTSGLIGNGMLALGRHPAELARLRDGLKDDPNLIRTAVEELLRFDSPVQLTGRLILEPIEIDGTKIEAGQDVITLIGAANRDPEVFPEPDRLDFTRRDNHHVAFGGGIHFCLGAPLARLEGQIAVGELVQRFPKLDVDADGAVLRDTVTLRGLTALPATV